MVNVSILQNSTHGGINLENDKNNSAVLDEAQKMPTETESENAECENTDAEESANNPVDSEEINYSAESEESLSQYSEETDSLPESEENAEKENDEKNALPDEPKSEKDDENECDTVLSDELARRKIHFEIQTPSPVKTREINAGSEKNKGFHYDKEEPAIPEKLKVVLAVAVIAIVMLSSLILAVNSAYARTDKARLPDIDMSETAPENTMIIESKNGIKQNAQSDKSDEFDTDVKAEEPLRFNVTLDFFNRDDIVVSTEKITLGELLATVGYTLTEGDKPSVDTDFVIAANIVINIDKVEYKTETVTEAIAYGSEKIETDTIPRGSTNYISYGETGEKNTTYTVEYVNGEENTRYAVSEEITKWPVNEKYEIGVGGSFVGADGKTYTYSYRRTVPATYYNIEGLTYIGTTADESVIAVDPNYIPLYTKLYVKNSKYDFGVRIASDTGSLVDEWEIDIWISPDNPQLPSFALTGYHYDMEIYYID